MAMEIQCSGCGKRIPFAGEVCPYCQRNKSDDQDKEVESQFTSFLGAIAGLIVGFIVYQFSTFKAAAISGAIVGLIVLALTSWVVHISNPKR